MAPKTAKATEADKSTKRAKANRTSKATRSLPPPRDRFDGEDHAVTLPYPDKIVNRSARKLRWDAEDSRLIEMKEIAAEVRNLLDDIEALSKLQRKIGDQSITDEEKTDASMLQSGIETCMKEHIEGVHQAVEDHDGAMELRGGDAKMYKGLAEGIAQRLRKEVEMGFLPFVMSEKNVEGAAKGFRAKRRMLLEPVRGAKAFGYLRMCCAQLVIQALDEGSVEMLKLRGDVEEAKSAWRGRRRE